MNILFLITKRQTRGAETFAVQLGEALQQLGHLVIIAGLYRPTANPISIPAGLTWIDLSQNAPTAVPSLTILRGVDELIRQYRIDLIQANASDTLKYAVLSRLLYRWSCPIVYRNASIMSSWIRSGLHRRIYTWLLRRTDAVASVSSKSKVDMQAFFGLPASRVEHLGIAVHEPSEHTKTSARARLQETIGKSLSPEDKIIIHIGAFTQEKNHAGLIRIFNRLQQQYTGSVRLVSIGNGPLMEEVVRQTTNGCIEWLGYRTDVPALLPAADLLLLPSHIEGTPGVVLEAGITNVVPIAYLVGAVNECYPPSLIDLLTVPPGDEVAMANRACHLLDEPAEAVIAATTLAAFIRANYAMAEIARRFEALYLRLSGNLSAVRKASVTEQSNVGV